MGKIGVGISRKKGEIIPCPECQNTLFILVKEKRVIRVPGKNPGEEIIVNVVCADCNYQIEEIIGGLK